MAAGVKSGQRRGSADSCPGCLHHQLGVVEWDTGECRKCMGLHWAAGSLMCPCPLQPVRNMQSARSIHPMHPLRPMPLMCCTTPCTSCTPCDPCDPRDLAGAQSHGTGFRLGHFWSVLPGTLPGHLSHAQLIAQQYCPCLVFQPTEGCLLRASQ